MESYPEPHQSNTGPGEQAEAYYPPPSNAMAHMQEENMMNMGHNIAPAMNGQADQQDSRPLDQLEQSFQNATPIQHHLDTAPNMQGGHITLGSIPLHFEGPDGAGSARKRSKVSRACDECRRKKVKCDAQSEQGPCSNCRRSNMECQFSRVPQKRGPSKGYINALEKRVRALEHTSHDALFDGGLGEGPNLVDVLSSAREAFNPRKRSFSNGTPAGDLATALQQQQARSLVPDQSWNANQQQFPPPQTVRPSTQQSSSMPVGEDHSFARPSFNIHDTFPPPTNQSNSELGRAIDGYSDVNNTLPENNMNSDVQHQVVDERALDSYFHCIHPTLPILSHDRMNVYNALGTCPSMLVEAFYTTLHAAVAAVAAPNLSQCDPSQSQIAADLLSRCELGEPFRSPQMRLVHVQALIFMVIEAQTRTHNPAVRQVGGSLSKWLASAVSAAMDMKLHNMVSFEANTIEDERVVSRRVWMSLCVLDRLAAHSTGDVVRISEEHFVISAQDIVTVGEPLYTLTRLTSILGLMAQMNAHESASDVEAPFSYGFFPKRLLESWELDHPPLNSSLLHIMYWHVKVVIALDIKATAPRVLQTAAVKTMEFIAHTDNLISPLLIYFTGFLVLILIELLRYESTKHDGQRSLKLLRDRALIPPGWEPVIRKLTAAIVPSEELDETETSGSQNLRRLANVAIAETERGREENEDVRVGEGVKEWSFKDFKDLRSLARHGFINVYNPNR